MQKQEHMVRYSADEVDEKLRRGESRTDWTRVDAMSEEELEASIDRAEEGEFDWNTVQVGIPGPKQQLTVHFDLEVIAWFRAQGSGYQTRMNAVLRSFVEVQKKRESSSVPRR